MLEVKDTFDPVECSNVDCAFLMRNLGKPTVVALRDRDAQVTLATVKPILDRINELIELEKAEGLKWVGVEAVKAAIETWLKVNAKWAWDYKHKRGAPRFPSLYSYDAKGKPHLSGPGSDSGRVRTYFGPNGERIPFAISLLPDAQIPWESPGFTETPAAAGLYVDSSASRIECTIKKQNGDICGHTESFKPDSRSSFNAARARMSKHLRKATEEVEAHRELHTNEFGSADATISQ